jgi:hypothetical protein
MTEAEYAALPHVCERCRKRVATVRVVKLDSQPYAQLCQACSEGLLGMVIAYCRPIREA